MSDNLEQDGAADLGLVGLTETELATYDVLVDRSATTRREVGKATGIQLSQLVRSLESLESKGLVSRVAGKPGQYAAVAPELGLELLVLQREEELKKARLVVAGLAERFHQARGGRDPAELIEVITGARAVSQHHSQVHHSARHELRIMARPPFIQSDDENRATAATMHQRGLRVRNIADYRHLDFNWAFIRDDIAHGEEYRSLPRVPLKLIIADDTSGIIPLEIRGKGYQSALLVHSSALLESLIEVFDTLWQFAYPLDVLDSKPDLDPSAAAIGESDRELLALLSAGTPDATIARRLGISPSTVQRRIRSLMTRLGAATRFQAGLQAAMRGWITATGPSDGSA